MNMTHLPKVLQEAVKKEAGAYATKMNAHLDGSEKFSRTEMEIICIKDFGAGASFYASLTGDQAALDIDLFTDLEAYFENLADADGSSEGYEPNHEMRLLVRIRKALSNFK